MSEQLGDWQMMVPSNGPRGYYLETDPDPIAMVIRVELFIHKPCRYNTPVT